MEAIIAAIVGSATFGEHIAIVSLAAVNIIMYKLLNLARADTKEARADLKEERESLSQDLHRLLTIIEILKDKMVNNNGTK